jgi:CDP-paratose 2-epimerase
MRRVLVTGGCGFIGSHTAHRLLLGGDEVHVLDDFSRPGAELNHQRLCDAGPVITHWANVTDAAAVEAVFKQHSPFDAVIHLAGQVAVTTSVKDPVADFNANALGTLNVLEAARRYSTRAAFLYSSTNKVYGGMEDVAIIARQRRYAYADLPEGIPESRPLDFHSPYGCSKGAADQYVRDYARIYGLRTVVLRQSCIYGTHQYGIEDQGWVAWLCIAAAQGRQITVYGDGKQVRDALYVDDLVAAYLRILERIDVAAGQIFNIGGGPGQTLSILELLDHLKERVSRKLQVAFAPRRPGDQLVCVMDIRKARQELDWAPQIGSADGVERLLDWINREYRTL